MCFKKSPKLKNFDKKLLVHMGITVNLQTLDILWPSEFTPMLSVLTSQQSAFNSGNNSTIPNTNCSFFGNNANVNAGITGIDKSKNETVCMKSI